MPTNDHILTLSCPDRRGIVAAVASFLNGQACNIIESAQFGDQETGRFFMRVRFRAEAEAAMPATIVSAFAATAAGFGMEWAIHPVAAKVRTLVMVSRFGHCLNDLLFRHATGALPIEIPLVVSNHRDFEGLVASNGIRFLHLPVDPKNKVAQEEALSRVIEAERIDLVVLARYMQVLSAGLCERLPGRIINIHHSFLPSFKGAKPYFEAHRRGVKLIGATAHYVTADLDEGPIIEQDVARVDHGLSAEDFVATGRDIESSVLARAVKWHAERRILSNGRKTVVFR